MPIYGSTVPYADPRDSTEQMKQKARRQGHFPQVIESSEELLHKKLKQINEGKEVSAIQQRRVALDNRLNYELETERMMSDLRRARMPGFRGLGARMMGAEQTATQIGQQY
jgi:flagellar basal body rod protein FlgB